MVRSHMACEDTCKPARHFAKNGSEFNKDLLPHWTSESSVHKPTGGADRSGERPAICEPRTQLPRTTC